MQFQLICLCDKGRPLTKEQLAEVPRYTGYFIIEDWPQGSTRNTWFDPFIRQAAQA